MIIANRLEEIDPCQGAVLLIDKPLRWTSFDVVNKLRRAIIFHTGLKKFKIGHAGTLDPLASGLLIVCVGKYTKMIEQFQVQTKQYTGTFTIGATTASHDLEKEPENFKPYHTITQADILNMAAKFTGEIEQIPPQYSAIRLNGRRAFDYMRLQQSVELKPRKVTMYNFDITSVNLPEVGFDIRCSKGTYIRAIARDLGEMLLCGAYLSSLRRIAIGDFKVSNVMDFTPFLTSANPVPQGRKLRDFEREIKCVNFTVDATANTSTDRVLTD
jgi:tRNA pseudouridine55 synthase